MSGKRFDGEVVIVTGSSTGIGQAALFGFAAEGASVVVHGTNEQRLENTKKRLLNDMKLPESRVLVVKGDIDKEETVQALVNETVKKFGKIDVLVNNAGLACKADADPSTIPNFDYVMAVNLRAPIRLIELALPHLSKTHGNIINVSSIAALVKPMDTPIMTVYGMSKAALDVFTKYECQRLAKLGVRINNINPGPVETNIGFRSMPPLPEDKMKVIRAEMDKLHVEFTAIRRVGRCEELVPIFLLLGDKKSEYLTGACWVADGGASNTAPPNAFPAMEKLFKGEK